nr:alpha-glucosidase [Anaerolineales bacterium]
MSTPAWWQNAICYQIYPRSFADGSGDGIGDLPGIIEKLDYLQSLGITAVWISPFFPSPNFDWGYDVADYTAVHPDYGTLADADRLIHEAHARGIRIILDLVLNHTSDQHPWFQQSKAGRENPYRDWYVWQDGKNGGPPNDWESIFGGSAWQYDETSGQYYYHFFFPEQPDLNWRHPPVKEALFAAVRFWLDRGVDGFRLDAIPCIYETAGFPDCEVDAPLEALFLSRMQAFETGGNELVEHKLRHQMHHPDVHILLQELRRLVDTYDDRLLLGETEEVVFYGNGRNELHSVFNFDLISRLDAAHLHRTLSARLPQLPDGAWESNTVGNHDRSRSYSFYGDGQHDELRARIALAMTMFLRGTPVFYYGEEIGMRNGVPDDVAQFRDGLGVWFYHALQRQGMSPEAALAAAAVHFCRDRCRTPMQWRPAPHAGFAPPGVTPWLPVNTDYAAGVNVAAQQDDPASMLAFFRQIARLRQAHPALRHGEMSLLPKHAAVLAFWRHAPGQRCLVALNMSARESELALDTAVSRRLYTSRGDAPWGGETAVLSLQPYEIWVGETHAA